MLALSPLGLPQQANNTDSLGQLSKIQGTYPILSTRSHNTLGVGTSGEPSYKTKDAPVARADTIQFHIIQPTCRKQRDQVSQAEVLAWNPSAEGNGERLEDCKFGVGLNYIMKANLNKQKMF